MSEPLKYGEHGVVSWPEYEQMRQERDQARQATGVWVRDFEILQGRYFQLEARAWSLINAMHELPEGDWTEELALLEKVMRGDER